MGERGAVRDGYHAWWWHTVNDNDLPAPEGAKRRRGSILRAGRFFLYRYGRVILKLEWNFPRLRGDYFWEWFRVEVEVKFSTDEDTGVQLHLALSKLFSVWVFTELPRRWLNPWMISDRVYGVRLFYIGQVAWVSLHHAEWAEDCGMTSYYRSGRGRSKYTPAQLWPGYLWKLRWPPVLNWLFGKAKTETRVIWTAPGVRVPVDGRDYVATIKWERRETRRPRWPWAYRKWTSAWIEVQDPPRFAGKGENSWDCGDDAIHGMGSRELSVAGVVGDYVKAVLKSRDKYGMPSELRK